MVTKIVKSVIEMAMKKAIDEISNCEKQIWIKPKKIPITISLNECIAMSINWLTQTMNKK